MSKKKECYLCYNTKKAEIERVPFFTNEKGEEVTEVKWLCKEDKGCQVN